MFALLDHIYNNLQFRKHKENKNTILIKIIEM